MSSSVEDSKIDLLDTPDQVKKKLKKAFCEPGNIENNGILAFCKSVIFPLLKEEGESVDRCPSILSFLSALVLPRSEEYGGPMSFTDYKQMEESFLKQVRTSRLDRSSTLALFRRKSIPVT